MKIFGLWALPIYVEFCFVESYSRVSRNGQARADAQDVAFTVSPIYVLTPGSRDKLRPGEAIDHPR